MNEEHILSELYTLEKDQIFVTSEFFILNSNISFFYVLNIKVDFVSWGSKMKLAIQEHYLTILYEKS